MTGGGGEVLEKVAEGEKEEDERPGAGRAKGGLEGGGSLPALLEEGEEVEEGGEEDEEKMWKGLGGAEESARLGRNSAKQKTRSYKITFPQQKE